MVDIYALRELQQSVEALRKAGRFHECISLGEHLLTNTSSVYDDESLFVVHHNLALASYYIGNIYQAFSHIIQYDELCSKKGNERHKMKANMLNFYLYDFLENYEQAKVVVKEAIHIADEIGDVQYASEAYTQLAHILNTEEHYSEAEHYAKIGLKYAKLLPVKEQLFFKYNAYYELINAYVGVEKFEYAKFYIQDLIDHDFQQLNIREQVRAYKAIGHYYYAEKDIDNSYESYMCAKERATQYGDLYLLKSINEELLLISEQRGDFRACYYIQKDYIEILNELNKKDLTQVALQLDTKRSFAEVEKRAATDPLTGIFNRLHLEKTATEWLWQSSQLQENVTCIVFDVDHFKMVNDCYGHLIGDAVLKSIAEACQQVLNQHKTLIARYGGDEFVLLLYNFSQQDALKMAEQLLHVIRTLTFETDNEMISITTSMGIADNRFGEITTFAQLFKEADDYLYKAKENGRNQIAAAFSQLPTI